MEVVVGDTEVRPRHLFGVAEEVTKITTKGNLVSGLISEPSKYQPENLSWTFTFKVTCTLLLVT